MRGQAGVAELSHNPPQQHEQRRSSQLPRSPNLHYYCPSCWQSVTDPSQRCPRCGTEPDRFSQESSFLEKVLRAVSHPEPNTARRAVWILGERRSIEALDAFEHVIESADIYMLLAIIEAAGKISGDRAVNLLQRLGQHRSPIVVRFAAEELNKLGPGSPAPGQ